MTTSTGASEARLIPYRRPTVSETTALERAREFQRDMATRRSVRMFSDAPVSKELIEQAVMTAASAPSGAHQQPWTFVAVSDPAVKHRIRDAAEAEERRNYEGGRMPEEWRDAMAPLGTDWHIAFLDQMGAGCRMGELARRLGVTQAAVSQLADQLEDMGLVTRTRDALDGRAVVVEPTKEVERGWLVARRAVDSIESLWRAELGDRRFQALVDAIGRLVAIDAD